MITPPHLRTKSLLIIAIAMASMTGTSRADVASAFGSRTVSFQDGGQIYQHVCQGCHMPEGGGAVGAGMFPSLAHNAKLETPGYSISMVLNGHGDMPWFSDMLTDRQIAAVLNYVRSHFGNDYKDAINVADVASARRPSPTPEQ